MESNRVIKPSLLLLHLRCQFHAHLWKLCSINFRCDICTAKCGHASFRMKLSRLSSVFGFNSHLPVEVAHN